MDWEKLCRILFEQLDTLKNLLELYEHERVALCRLDTAMLEESVEKKNIAFSKFNKLEQSRIGLCKENSLNETTLKDLIEIAPKEYVNRLAEVRKDLKKIAEKLDSRRMMNHSLILNAQLQTELLIGIIGSAKTETYTQKGRLANGGLSTMNRTI